MCRVFNVRRPASILLGCILAAWPSTSLSAQVPEFEAQTATAPQSNSQPYAESIQDESDASKVDRAAEVNRSPATAPNIPPAESRHFVQHS